MLALPFAGLMAQRAFCDDRDRRRKAPHGQELKRLATRYLDEIGFIVHKDSRDTIRRIHREIREHFAARADAARADAAAGDRQAAAAAAARPPRAGTRRRDADARRRTAGPTRRHRASS